ncbi:jg7041 [Pararge aegeria aegeria]|uniref:Jg7041 protein n=1 Tax=Pararge aegeria aegeria TaxID=348720 RepID=A0A8S4RGY1_9NEOP|nr:jg7041 [Pararge aegeria aegeria]
MQTSGQIEATIANTRSEDDLPIGTIACMTLAPVPVVNQRRSNDEARNSHTADARNARRIVRQRQYNVIKALVFTKFQFTLRIFGDSLHDPLRTWFQVAQRGTRARRPPRALRTRDMLVVGAMAIGQSSKVETTNKQAYKESDGEWLEEKGLGVMALLGKGLCSAVNAG